MFQNHTFTHFESIERKATRLERENGGYAAEERYREALAGFEHILSPTHKHTVALAYQFAAFLANHDRMNEADRILNWVTEKHIRRWGTNHQNTLKHLLHVSKLLNGWSLSDEALSVLYCVLDTWDGKGHDSVNKDMAVQLGRTQNKQPSGAAPRTHLRHPRSQERLKTLAEIGDPLQIDVQLSLADAGLQAGDESTEENFLVLIGACERYWQRLSLEIIRAKCTLINPYQKQCSYEDCSIALKEAEAAVQKSFEPNIE